VVKRFESTPERRHVGRQGWIMVLSHYHRHDVDQVSEAEGN